MIKLFQNKEVVNMKEEINKLVKITLFVISSLFVLLFTIEKILNYVSAILARIVYEEPSIDYVVSDSFKQATEALMPEYIFTFIVLVSVLVAIPLCYKNKHRKISKVTIILIDIIFLLDVISFIGIQSTPAFGVGSIFILIYSLIITFLIFMKDKLKI